MARTKINSSQMVVTATMSPQTSDLAALGTGSLMWSDLFLASASVINFNNGDITITHASNTLTIAGGTFATAALTTSTIVASGIIKTDDATEATSTTDGSLQTDGGLSIAKSAVIGDDLDLLSDGAIMNFGSTSKFTLTDQSANNTVMAASGHRLAFGNAGEYIAGDGTDLKIVSSGDVDITGDTDVVGGLSSTQATTLASAAGVTTIGSTTGATFSAAGLLNVNNTTDATSKTDGSLQTDGGLSVAKAIYSGTAATLAADSGVVTMGATTALTVSAAGLLNVNNATEATSATDGSLQTDGGLSVVKSAVIGDDLDLLSDGAIFSIGAGQDVKITHDGGTGATLASAGAFVIDGAAAVTMDSDAALTLGGASIDMDADGGAVAIDGTGGLNLATATSGVAISIGHSTSETTINDNLSVTGDFSIAADLIHTGDTNNKISFGTDTQSFQTGGTARINLSDSGLQIGSGARVTTILDEDAMGTDSATALATQQSIKAYVDATTAGMDLKESVAAAYTASFTMASTASTSTLVLASGEGGWTAASDTTIADDFASYVATNGTDYSSTTTFVSFTSISSEMGDVLADDTITLNDGSNTWTATVAAVASATATKASSFGSTLASTTLTSSTSAISPYGGGWSVALMQAISGDALVIGSWVGTVTSAPSSTSGTLGVSYSSGADQTPNGGLTTTLIGDAIQVSSASGTLDVSAMNGGQTVTVTRATSASYSVDGVTMSADDRVLVKDSVNSNSAGAHGKWNGVYTVGSLAGSTVTLTRASDFNAASEFIGAPFFLVDAGTDNGAHGFVSSMSSSPTIGTTALTFYQFSAPGQDAVAGTGLSMTGNVLSVDAAQTQITSVGTVATGVWQGTAVASAYLDADTAHLTTTQTFSGAKTFSAAAAITDSTAASSATTGALKVTGGISTQADLYVGDDLALASDGAVLSFGDSAPTSLTHIASNDAIRLNSSKKLEFADAGTFIHQSTDGVLTIESDTTVDINGAVAMDGALTGLTSINVAGTITGDTSLTLDSTTISTAEIGVLDGAAQGTSAASKAMVTDSDGDILMPDSDKFELGAGSDMQLYHDGTNSYIANKTGELKVATETSGIAVTIGHSTSEVTIADNLNTTGRILVNDATEATSTTDGSLQTDGGLSVAKGAVIGDDLDLLSDGAIFAMGAGQDVKITHDGGTGATLASAGAFVVDGAAAVTVDSDAALTLGGASIDVDADGGAIALDGTGGVSLGTATSGVAISIGHSTSETTVNDNLTVTGDAAVTGTLSMAADLVHTGDTNNKIAFGTDTQSFQTGGTARMNISDSGLQVGSGARVTTILDEDGMGTDSATSLATQQSIKAYVDATVTAADLDLATDSGSIDVADNETLTIAGGEGIDTSASGTTVTITCEEATSSNKGVASFGNGLQVSSGAVTLKAVSQEFVANAAASSVRGDDGATRAALLTSTDTVATFATATDVVLDGSLKVYLNGMLQRKTISGATADYSHTPGDASTADYITLVSAIDTDDVLVIEYVAQ